VAFSAVTTVGRVEVEASGPVEAVAIEAAGAEMT